MEGEGGSAAAAAEEAAEEISTFAPPPEAAVARAGSGQLPLTAAQAELSALIEAKLPKHAKVVARPQPGKGKEVSPCWEYFCCIEYDNGTPEQVMCLVRVRDNANVTSVCGKLQAKKRDNSTTNYQRHLKDTKCPAHQAAHGHVITASGRTDASKRRKADAAIGRSISSSTSSCGGSSKAFPVATGRGSIGYHLPKAQPALASKAQHEEYKRRLVLLSAVDLRPCSISSGHGFQALIGHVAPAFAGYELCNKTFDRILIEEYNAAKAQVVAALETQHNDLCGQPFCSLQLDLGSEANRSFFTLSVSLLDAAFNYQRLMLVNREFPLQHKADDISAFIVQVRSVTPSNHHASTTMCVTMCAAQCVTC
jgi:hypothetical protein